MGKGRYISKMCFIDLKQTSKVIQVILFFPKTVVIHCLHKEKEREKSQNFKSGKNKYIKQMF